MTGNHPHPATSFKSPALRIPLIYLAIGAIWILFSDEMVSFLGSRELATTLSILKGWFFVAVTACILHYLIRKYLVVVETSREQTAASEERFRNIFSRSPIAIGIGEIQNGLLIEVNDAWLRLYGYEHSEVIGRTTAELDLYVRSEERDELIRKIDEQGHILNHEIQFRRKDGAVMDVLYSADRIEFKGRPCLQVMMTDITEQKRHESALRESEKMYRSLFQNMLNGFALCRMIYDGDIPMDFVYLSVNDAFVKQTGLKDVVGRRVTEVIPGIRKSDPGLFGIYGRVALTGKPEQFEIYVEALEQWYWVSVYSPARDHFVAVFDVISRRKRTEAAREATLELLRICNRAEDLPGLMRELMGFFRGVTGCESIGVRLRDSDDFPYFVTRGFSEEFVLAEKSLCAYDQNGELVRDSAGHPVLDCMCGNILSGRFDPSQPFFTPHGSFWTNSTSDLLARTKDEDRKSKTRNRCSSEGYESVALLPLGYRNETYGLFQFNDREKGRFSPEKIAFYEELVDYVSIALSKLKSDDLLRESNRRLQLATSSAELGVWDWDIDSDHLVVDDRILELYGIRRSDFIGRMRTWEDALHQDDRDRAIASVQVALQDNKNLDFEFRIIRSDGNIRHIRSNAITIRDAGGMALRMIGLNQDITDKKILQEQLRQSQKMEAIGTLAGGIAHDFNNILTAIAGYSTLLMIGLKTGGRHQEYIDNLMALVERAANLTRGLLAFSRSQAMTLKQINLNNIVTTMNKLISRLIGEDIVVETNLSPSPLTVMADCGQIEQVLMNLATNARDAMHDGGTLTIATELVNLEVDEQLLVDSSQPGPYARLTVSDTGIGMEESVAGRIFEPFFTTKEPGKGTGLGLSIIYGIVKQHNGLVTVASRPGEGTTFTIHLPIVTVAETSVNGKASQPVAGGTETVLVAEDDAAIRKVIGHILQQFGYGIMEAADGEEAVNIFREHAADISLVILDAVMPRKNAREAFTDLQEIKPDVKTLFISGYPADVIAHRGMLPEGAMFLPKPISPIDLLRNIRQVLDGQHENGN